MPIDTVETRKHLAAFSFGPLFIEELGWNHYDAALEVRVDNQVFKLSAIAEKCGMTAFVCGAGPDGRIPNHNARGKIERQVAKFAHEHIIIFMDEKKSGQIWQWVRREQGQPTACREHIYQVGQPGDSLVQKLNTLMVNLEEEESLTLVDVTGRARKAFDVERITKRFYDRFKAEHATFLRFLKGIPDDEMQRWYVSVMLNRLMFIYFIQKKGFLVGDANYLKNRLSQCRKELGNNHYYRDFLRLLFFEGLSKRKDDRSAKTRQLLGDVPYLNGGIFLPHQIEQVHGSTIEIVDAAFEKLFDFFDSYQWHLDERPLRKDDEINPDVLGYIFEKYINQKQMGAYYTKEDITEYISKNAVIPYVFDAALAERKRAFENSNGSTVWDLLKEDPDRYIYPAIRYGVGKPLPSDIEEGIDTTNGDLLFRRESWNKLASAEHALPTETWREVIGRRLRYIEIRNKLLAGEVHDIDGFITLNLNIRQFAQDAVAGCDDPESLRAFWHAIDAVTILDPTCGSGAFLFAALNVLEPLYEACLERMEVFLNDLTPSGDRRCDQDLSDFRQVLERVQTHPNRRYFIFKTIILNNLFGVDIMEEAVEVCKLRLFLKLAAQIEPDMKQNNFGIEPLPDIDFNIRAGNTLVGFVTYDEVRRAVTSKLDFDDVMEKISLKAEVLQHAFDAFRQRQIDGTDSVPTQQKKELRSHLLRLQDELNRYLAGEYGVKQIKNEAYATWLKSHEPFHWFVEFFGILKRGGFDVIIGNPPYVEYKDIIATYRVSNYATLDCSNLFAFVLERCGVYAHSASRLGMIVPLSAFSTDRMVPLISHFKRRSFLVHIANFSWRPGKLFDGVNLQLSIVLQKVGTPLAGVYSSQYALWDSEARPELFEKIEYTIANDNTLPGSIPKIGLSTAASILSKLRARRE